MAGILKERIKEVLTKGVSAIYPSRKALEDVLLSGKKLKIYQGFDPSMPSLHLGNMVGILKLRQFQELGHKIIFLVGDFTGMIGDPTGKLSARKQLTRKEVLRNAKGFQKQASRFLNFKGKNKAEVLFNSQWLDKITFKDLIKLSSHFTVQRMIERDFFQERLKKGQPIFLHEFLYPLAQAIDSLKMKVDLEIGGRDQMFNMLVGRDLIMALEKREKFVLTTKLLIDKEGRKIGKTTGNAVFLDMKPEEMFGAIMAFPDEVIFPAFEILTLLSLKEISSLKSSFQKKNISPRDLKKRLAFEVVKLNYGTLKADSAQKEFEDVFQKRNLPKNIKKVKIDKKKITLLDVLFSFSLASSKSEARRLIIQGGVKVNGKKEVNWQKPFLFARSTIIQVGKRKFLKLVPKEKKD